ncbi:hypothetical protein HFO98_35775 [Rhizobium leguminosarum]|uniref:hypothetical protein n=1 Tax=Rhizobium leguminosarum TaxID=384 RepID=UPI001C9758DF|nr:hypothetical protein [Rhizobium leguminosarum]MBY5413623.1 hypothetical protein [Rhizobium leguminosarum]
MSWEIGAALLVGFIANPMLEWLKSLLVARSASRTARADLVAKLRLTLGYFDAYAELVNTAFGPYPKEAVLGPFEMRAFRSMGAFNLQPVHDLIEQITKLGLRESTISGAGQALTRKVLLLFYAFEQLKSVSLKQGQTSELFVLQTGDNDLISQARDGHSELIAFVMEPLADVLGVDMTSVIDYAIQRWEMDISIKRARLAKAESDAAMERARKLFPNLPNAQRSPPNPGTSKPAEPKNQTD